jgi:hypothetical protein
MLDFPEALIDQLESIGPQIARRAVAERRNIVTEIIGAELVPTEKLISALKLAGYSVEVVAITCELEESIRRSANRGDNISAYYAEQFQRQWIIDACSQFVRASGAPEQIESTLPEGRLNSGMKPHDR